MTHASESPRWMPEIRDTLVLATPVVITQVAQISMGFVDTVMVGRLGPEALAGVALGSTLFYTLIVVCMGVVMAVGPMVSQAFGAGDHATIGRSVRQGQWLAMILAIVFTLAIWNVEPALRLLGQSETNIAAAVSYLRAIVWGAFPFLGFVGLRGFVEGVSRPRPVMVIAFVGVFANIGLNWVLMYGKFGVPALGIVGTGIASATVFWLNFLALLVFVARERDFGIFRLFSTLGRPDGNMFRQLFRIGWPIGGSLGIESSLFMITVMMMGWISTDALAAHQVAIQCAAFTFMVPLGIGMAASVRVGQAAGRGDLQGVRWAGRAALAVSTTYMTLAALAFWLIPRGIVGLYLDLSVPRNEPVVALAVILLRIAAVFQIFDGIQVTAAGALRGLKDTRVPMLISVASYWIVGLTSGYVLGFKAAWGPPGLWWGLVLGLASAAILLVLRFRRSTSSARDA